MNSLRGYIIVAGAFILTGILIAASILIIHRKESFTPPAPTVGRYQLRSEAGQSPLIFDTATGRIYVLETNGTFIIRDPILETERRTFSFEQAKPPASPRLPNFGDKSP
jgi:hypothetical protein